MKNKNRKFWFFLFQNTYWCNKAHFEYLKKKKKKYLNLLVRCQDRKICQYN